MKPSIAALLLLAAAACLALPLNAVIAQEGARLMKKTTEWNAKCGNAEPGSKLWYACYPKRVELSGEWGKLVVDINEELSGIGDRKPDEEKLLSDRRKMVEFELSYALHTIKCLGVNTTECSNEESRLSEERKLWRNDLAWWSSLRQLDKNGKPIPIKGVDF